MFNSSHEFQKPQQTMKWMSIWMRIQVKMLIWSPPRTVPLTLRNNLKSWPRTTSWTLTDSSRRSGKSGRRKQRRGGEKQRGKQRGEKELQRRDLGMQEEQQKRGGEKLKGQPRKNIEELRRQPRKNGEESARWGTGRNWGGYRGGTFLKLGEGSKAPEKGLANGWRRTSQKRNWKRYQRRSEGRLDEIENGSSRKPSFCQSLWGGLPGSGTSSPNIRSMACPSGGDCTVSL